MRSENTLTILDITGNLNKATITPQDITELISLFNNLNQNQLINLTRRESDANNNESN